MRSPARATIASVTALFCTVLVWRYAAEGTSATAPEERPQQAASRGLLHTPSPSSPAPATGSSAASNQQHHKPAQRDHEEASQKTSISDCPAPGEALAAAQSWAGLGSTLWPSSAHIMHFEWALWVDDRPYLLKVLWNGAGPEGFTFEAMVGQAMKSVTRWGEANKKMGDTATEPPLSKHELLDDPSAPVTNFATQVRREGLSQTEAWESVEQWLEDKGVPPSVRDQSASWSDRVLIASPFPIPSVYEACNRSEGWAPPALVEFTGERITRYAAGPVRCTSEHAHSADDPDELLCSCATEE